jgi:Beta-propeller repeat
MKMKKIQFTLFFVLVACFFTQAQSITLTPNGIKPGLVGGHPRLSWSAIQAIASPQEGDMVGDITFKCLRVYSGSKWVPISQNTEGPDITLFANVGSIDYEFGNDIATDPSGNVYVAGSFQNTCNFSGISKTAAGNSDLYVCKYSPTGTVLWIYTASGCAQDDYANALSIDATGNVYVAGSFGGPITFGSTAKTSAGTQDVFLLKLNASGAQQWVQTGGGANYDTGNDVATDAAGNIFIIGYIVGPVTFGVTSANTIAGLEDFFLIKYNAAGTLQYIKNGFSGSEDYGTKVAVDNAGNVIVFGNYYQSGQYGFFVGKYDNTATNNLLWAQSSSPGTGYTSAKGLAINNSNEIFLAGSFENTLTFGSTVLYTYGLSDIYLIKFDLNGTLQFAKSYGGPGNDNAGDLTVNPLNTRIYMTGDVSANAVFNDYTVPIAGGSDSFIAKFDSYSLDLYYVKTTGGKSEEISSAIKIDASGNIYVGGYYYNTSYFGNYEKSSVGSSDSFLMLIKE